MHTWQLCTSDNIHKRWCILQDYSAEQYVGSPDPNSGTLTPRATPWPALQMALARTLHYTGEWHLSHVCLYAAREQPRINAAQQFCVSCLFNSRACSSLAHVA